MFPCFFPSVFFQLATTSWKSGKVSAAGVGVLMSTLVPKQNATLATAVVLLVMGGAISEPQVIADATGVAWALRWCWCGDGNGFWMALFTSCMWLLELVLETGWFLPWTTKRCCTCSKKLIQDVKAGWGVPLRKYQMPSLFGRYHHTSRKPWLVNLGLTLLECPKGKFDNVWKHALLVRNLW